MAPSCVDKGGILPTEHRNHFKVARDGQRRRDGQRKRERERERERERVRATQGRKLPLAPNICAPNHCMWEEMMLLNVDPATRRPSVSLKGRQSNSCPTPCARCLLLLAED